MTKNNIRKFYYNFIHTFPLILLFFLSFTGFDLSFFLFENNYYFNFTYAVIFYWILKKPERLGYGLIFLAGIINDVVQNLPIGVSSINYLLLCSIAAFIRTRTLMPSLLYDWILFLTAVLIISSINYTTLTLVFQYPIKYGTLMISSFITFLIYPIISKLFDQITLIDLREENAK
jgi:rod shape-determining protein MreD